MKKYYIIGLLLCVIVALFFIYRRNYDYEIIEYAYIEGFDLGNNVALMKSEEEYEEYLDMVSTEGTDEEFLEKINEYNGDFFEDNMLIVIYEYEISGSHKMSINDITYEGTTIHVEIKRKIPRTVSDDIKNCAYIIELPRDDKYSSVEYTFIEERMWFK